MKSTIFKMIIIGLTSVGIAGCSNQQLGPPLVKITVTESNSGAITITVDPYELDLATRPGAHIINFKLTSSNFSFVTDAEKAIEVLADNGSARQFTGHDHGNVGKVILVKDKNTGGLAYHYILRLKDDQNRRIELDPLIKNRD